MRDPSAPGQTRRMTRGQNMRATVAITLLWLSVINARPLDDYEQNKTTLLQEESEYSVGAQINLTPDEQRVNHILMALKTQETKQSFLNPEKYNFVKHYFTYKDQIESSSVYQIIKRMPKGALLHVHSTFVLDENYMVSLTYEDHLYACYTDTDLKFHFSDGVPQRPCSTKWTLISELRNATGAERFDSELKKRFTLYSGDKKDIDADINTVWKKFNDIHSITKAIISFRPVREKYIYNSLKRFYDDNVMYVEMRSGLHRLYELNGTVHDPMELVRVHRDVTKKFIEDHPDFIGMKFILTKHRSADLKDIQFAVDIARKVKQEYPYMFAGFDLVGQEDPGKRLSQFLPTLLDAKKDMNFYFHAGETNWFGMPTDENLVDAVLLGTKRIGHGYALTKHPVLMSLLKKNDIAVEVNVISNSVLALTRDLRNHPLATFLSFGIPVVLSSDDPGVWGADPLSQDFYVAFMAVASQRSDLRLLKQLAMNSIRYSALENGRKVKLFKVFHRRWSEFIKEVLDMYGDTQELMRLNATFILV